MRALHLVVVTRLSATSVYGTPGGIDLATIGCDAALATAIGADNAWEIQSAIVATGCCGPGGSGGAGQLPPWRPRWASLCGG